MNDFCFREKHGTQQKVNKRLVEKVKQDYGFSDILSKLIISRKYDLSKKYMELKINIK